MRLLFIGPPGAGKGTQAALVAARLGIPHISTGEMFRFHVSNGTDLGRQVEAILEAGAYVPDELTVAMLAERMRDADTTTGFILDGFPRTAQQVAALDQLLGDQGLDRVVLFEVKEDALVDRMLARGRVDDTEETIRRTVPNLRRGDSAAARPLQGTWPGDRGGWTRRSRRSHRAGAGSHRAGRVNQ